MKSLFNILIVCFSLSAGLLFGHASGILNGESLLWNRYAFIVKILSRGEAVKNCVGTLITPSLVVTAPECIKNETTHGKLQEFLVLISRLESLPLASRNESSLVALPSDAYQAHLIEAEARFALLKIKPLDVKNLCPPTPVPKRVARLPLNPNLDDSRANVRIDIGSLSDDKCYLLSFETLELGENFASKADLTRLSLERLRDEEINAKVGLYTTRIVNNSTACFDDMGAALICYVAELEEEFLVGMFRFLNFIDGVELDRSSPAHCTLAVEMGFDAFVGDAQLLRAIQRHDYGGFFDVYETCEFTQLQ